MSFNPICGVRRNAVERKAFNERRDIFFPECCKKGKWTIIITVKWIVPYSVNTDYIVKVAKQAQIYNSGWIKIFHESRFYSRNNYQHSLWFSIYIKVFIIVVGINFHARNILYTNMLKVALTNLNHMFLRQSAIEKYHMGHHLNKHFK